MGLTLVVMAAGLGSRYGGLKQVAPVGPNGETLMDYAVYDALRAGFGRAVFIVTAAMARDFEETAARRWAGLAEVKVVVQNPDDLPGGFVCPRDRARPWGTGHAALACRGVVDTPFMIINADDFYGQAAFKALAGFLANPPQSGKRAYCMAGYTLRNTLTENGSVSRGVCAVSSGGTLLRIDERTQIEPLGNAARYWEDDAPHALTGDEIVSLNAWGFDPAAFDRLAGLFEAFLRENAADLSRKEFYLPTAVGAMMAEGFADVHVLPIQGKWYGVTYAGDREPVRAAIAKMTDDGLYPRKLWH